MNTVTYEITIKDDGYTPQASDVRNFLNKYKHIAPVSVVTVKKTYEERS